VGCVLTRAAGLAGWLDGYGVTHVAMESTGVNQKNHEVCHLADAGMKAPYNISRHASGWARLTQGKENPENALLEGGNDRTNEGRNTGGGSRQRWVVRGGSPRIRLLAAGGGDHQGHRARIEAR